MKHKSLIPALAAVVVLAAIVLASLSTPGGYTTATVEEFAAAQDLPATDGGPGGGQAEYSEYPENPAVGGRGGAMEVPAEDTTVSADDGYYAEPEPTETSPVENCGAGTLSCFEEEVRYEIDRLNMAGYDVDEMGQTVCAAIDNRSGSVLHDLLDFDRADGWGNSIGDVNVGILMRESAQHICPEHMDYVEDEIQMLVR